MLVVGENDIRDNERGCVVLSKPRTAREDHDSFVKHVEHEKETMQITF